MKNIAPFRALVVIITEASQPTEKELHISIDTFRIQLLVFKKLSNVANDNGLFDDRI